MKTRKGRNFNGLCKDAPDSNLSGLSISECEIAEGENGKQSRGAIAKCNWWTTEPNVGRVANGIPNRVDRLRGLGNAIVPQVAEWIGRQIVGALK